MKIIKYQKGKGNEYKITTNKGDYKLYDDVIIKYSLLLKKEINKAEFDKILLENNLLNAYYDSLKAISTKLRTEKEIRTLLNKKGYNEREISYAIDRLNKENYLNHKIYIEAYIHDMLNLYLVGEKKIMSNLMVLGFKEAEIAPFLSKIDKSIYQEKISKYVTKKAKTNKKSKIEFRRKITNELINKGFNKSDIEQCLDNIIIEDNPEEIKKLVTKLTTKYSRKYDESTVKLKVKSYLYQKGYYNIDDYLN